MFQTDHDFSNFHGAARCLSGGPICITDVPGQHDLSLINRMTASTPDGRLVILRANKIGKASEVYNSHTEPRLLRIQTEHLGASIIGLFNVGTSTLTEFQSLKEFQNVLNTIPYIIHHHGSDNIVGPWTLEDDFTMVELSIPVHGFEILTAHPVYTFAETRVAVLGLLGKIVPGTAIIKCEYATRSSGIEIRVSMKALGTLGTVTQAFTSIIALILPRNIRVRSSLQRQPPLDNCGGISRYRCGTLYQHGEVYTSNSSRSTMGRARFDVFRVREKSRRCHGSSTITQIHTLCVNYLLPVMRKPWAYLWRHKIPNFRSFRGCTFSTLVEFWTFSIKATSRRQAAQHLEVCYTTSY
jgi:hypothetical protein